MKEYDIKTIWMNIHKNNLSNIENPVTFKKLMQQSHSRIITKVMNEFKLRILIYLISLLAILGIVVYAFVYLKLNCSFLVILPFAIAGLFLTFKVISEVIRYIVLNNQDDNKPIKEATANLRNRLKKIKAFDFYINLSLCYGIAGLFTMGYLFDFGGFKIFFQSTQQSGLFTIFILILLVIPWIMRTSTERRYQKYDLSLKSTVDYLSDDAS